jgi:hypothetical protein
MESYPTRVPTLESAERTLTYMRDAPAGLWGIVSLLASASLTGLWLTGFDRTFGRWILIVGVVGLVVAKLRLHTTFGLLLAGPALACLLGGAIAWATGRTDWLWIPAIPATVWGIRRIWRYGRAARAYRESLHAARHTGCSIAFFRPFDTRYAEWARNLILPVLKSYGRVTHVTDGAFEAAPGQGGLSAAYEDQVKDVLSRIDEYDTATRRMIDLTQKVVGSDLLAGTRMDDATWKAGVLDLLTRTDVAVVDVSTVSDNVLWELANCLRRLPPERVILIVSLDALEDVKRRQPALMKTFSEAGGTNMEPVLAYHPTNALPFAESLHARMVAIAADAFGR